MKLEERDESVERKQTYDACKEAYEERLNTSECPVLEELRLLSHSTPFPSSTILLQVLGHVDVINFHSANKILKLGDCRKMEMDRSSKKILLCSVRPFCVLQNLFFFTILLQ